MFRIKKGLFSLGYMNLYCSQNTIFNCMVSSVSAFSRSLLHNASNALNQLQKKTFVVTYYFNSLIVYDQKFLNKSNSFFSILACLNIPNSSFKKLHKEPVIIYASTSKTESRFGIQKSQWVEIF